MKKTLIDTVLMAETLNHEGRRELRRKNINKNFVYFSALRGENKFLSFLCIFVAKLKFSVPSGRDSAKGFMSSVAKVYR